MIIGELDGCEGEEASGLQSRRRQEQCPVAHLELPEELALDMDIMTTTTLALGPKELQERNKLAGSPPKALIESEEILLGGFIMHQTRDNSKSFSEESPGFTRSESLSISRIAPYALTAYVLGLFHFL